MEILHINATGPQPVSATALGKSLPSDGFVWIDFDHTDTEGMALLTALVDARPDDIQDCSTLSPVPKLHLYADHGFSAINGVARGADGRLHFQPLKVFRNEQLIITVLGPIHRMLTPESARREITLVHERLDEPGRPASTQDVISAIRFEMLRSHEELIGNAVRRIAMLEERIMDTDAIAAETLLQDLIELRHDLQRIGTNAAQAFESYSQLLKQIRTGNGDSAVDPRRIKELKQAYGHVMKTANLEREYLQEMVDLFQTRVSTELNKFVRKITALGTIGIALTVIAGIFGMNFTNMPELEWTYGYPYAIGLMLLASLVLGLAFRRKGWI